MQIELTDAAWSDSVRITTAAPTASTYEGMLFTACPITNLVAINTSPSPLSGDAKQAQSGDYHVVPVSRIQSFQLLALPSNASESPSFTDALPPIQALDNRVLKQREAKAIGEALDREARRGKGVTREAQDIFDAFSRTMPARWDGQNIVVADAVAIASPYRVDDCRPLVEGDTAALARVRKVVSFMMPRVLIVFLAADDADVFYLSSKWSARRLNFAMLVLLSGRPAHLPAMPVTSARVVRQCMPDSTFRKGFNAIWSIKLSSWRYMRI